MMKLSEMTQLQKAALYETLPFFATVPAVVEPVVPPVPTPEPKSTVAPIKRGPGRPRK